MMTNEIVTMTESMISTIRCPPFHRPIRREKRTKPHAAVAAAQVEAIHRRHLAVVVEVDRLPAVVAGQATPPKRAAKAIPLPLWPR